MCLLSLLLPRALAQEDNGQVHGFISFALPVLVVSEELSEETTSVLVPLAREVGDTGRVLAAIEVSQQLYLSC